MIKIDLRRVTQELLVAYEHDAIQQVWKTPMSPVESQTFEWVAIDFLVSFYGNIDNFVRVGKCGLCSVSVGHVYGLVMVTQKVWLE